MLPRAPRLIMFWTNLILLSSTAESGLNVIWLLFDHRSSDHYWTSFVGPCTGCNFLKDLCLRYWTLFTVRRQEYSSTSAVSLSRRMLMFKLLLRVNLCNSVWLRVHSRTTFFHEDDHWICSTRWGAAIKYVHASVAASFNSHDKPSTFGRRNRHIPHQRRPQQQQQQQQPKHPIFIKKKTKKKNNNNNRSNHRNKHGSSKWRRKRGFPRSSSCR